MKREIRASTVTGPAGVGAVIDVGQESFVVPGLALWRQEQLRIVPLPRLADRLRKVLKAPRSDKPSLMIRRFPLEMFCEKCRRIVTWRTQMEQEDQPPACPHSGCGGSLVPMRFVSTCEHGHLRDVDWWKWAHSGANRNTGCKVYDRLSFKVNPSASTGGLGSLNVECACGSSRSLEEITSKHAVKGVFQACSGTHPWIRGSAENCESEVVVLQRGATNLHYPSTISALDIPVEHSEEPAAQFAEQVRGLQKYQRLVGLIKSASGDTKDFIQDIAELLAAQAGCEAAVVLEVATADADGRELRGAGGTTKLTEPVDQAVFLEEEWQTFAAVLERGELSSGNFVAVTEELSTTAPPWMKNLLQGVLLIRRLREVRAYLGFQRVRPGPAERTVKPDVAKPENWLPASEVYGEGFVLAFNFGALERWTERLPEAEQSALRGLDQKRREENFWFLPEVDPAFVAVHTLSHLLLRQVTFNCGYSSSSLRERIYFDRKKRYAGLMIYTADGDSEGSLGGLVRQGRADRLVTSLTEAVEQGRWCSSDPVCSESAGQGLGGFNHAACHACSLLSETSCTYANTLLDRRMLTDPDWGLIGSVGG